MTIAALETRHKGYVFRSRLEARVAIILDGFGWKWRYESEGFSTPYGNYLPDFEVLAPAMWIEVKGEDPTEVEKLKLRSVAQQTEKVGMFFIGTKKIYNNEKQLVNTILWEEFPAKWREITNFCGGPGRTECTDPFDCVQYPKGWLSSTDWCEKIQSAYFSIPLTTVEKAYNKAKSARFGT
jgi:hypothetical protein